MTPELHEAIKAQQGILSQAQIALKLGVSRRTVGRVIHDGELSKTKDAEIKDLRQQIEDLKKLVLDVTSQKSPQRIRQELNPEFFKKTFKSSEHHYSSPYRNSPGKELMQIYNVDVPVPYGRSWSELASQDWFMSMHPASPDCEKYPYPTSEREEKNNPQSPVVYLDPPAGTHCTCNKCNEWRTGLAFEEHMKKAYIMAVAEREVFRKVR